MRWHEFTTNLHPAARIALHFALGAGFHAVSMIQGMAGLSSDARHLARQLDEAIAHLTAARRLLDDRTTM